MLTILTVLFSVAMVLVSFVLMLLVLIQLPKKEAGAGLAFGAGATDALFGAGGGNALTKITKVSATAFFIIALILSILKSREKAITTNEFQNRLKAIPAAAPISPVVTPTPPATNATVAATGTSAPVSLSLPSTPVVAGTNTPAAGTNAPKK